MTGVVREPFDWIGVAGRAEDEGEVIVAGLALEVCAIESLVATLAYGKGFGRGTRVTIVHKRASGKSISFHIVVVLSGKLDREPQVSRIVLRPHIV